MRHTPPRRADVATIAIDETHQISAWITYVPERRAYILTVIPEELRTYSDGSIVRIAGAYSGRRVHVEDAPRFSARRLGELAAAAHVVAYVDTFAAHATSISSIEA